MTWRLMKLAAPNSNWPYSKRLIGSTVIVKKNCSNRFSCDQAEGIELLVYSSVAQQMLGEFLCNFVQVHDRSVVLNSMWTNDSFYERNLKKKKNKTICDSWIMNEWMKKKLSLILNATTFVHSCLLLIKQKSSTHPKHKVWLHSIIYFRLKSK